MGVLKKHVLNFIFFPNLSKNAEKVRVYVEIWAELLLFMAISDSPVDTLLDHLLCNQFFFSPKRRWNSHSHMIIFRKIFPTWRYLRSIYVTMKRSCSSSCVKEPELSWEVFYKGDLHDYTDNTSSIVLETFAINLVETQALAWAGRASLICSGCRTISRALKACRKITSRVALCCIGMTQTCCTRDTCCTCYTSKGYDPTTGLWNSHTGCPTPQQNSWKWKAMWGFMHL